MEDLFRLNEQRHQIVVELKVVLQSVQAYLKLDKKHRLYKDIASFIKGKSLFKSCNTYVRLFLIQGALNIVGQQQPMLLISSEDRKRKPYALPVQLVLYVGMSE